MHALPISSFLIMQLFKIRFLKKNFNLKFLRFFVLKKCSLFSKCEFPLFTVSYLADNFSENVDMEF